MIKDSDSNRVNFAGCRYIMQDESSGASAEDGLQKWRVVVSIMTKLNGQTTRSCDKLGSMVWRNNTYH